ncbi:hypothetical protein JIN86_18415 [Lysinibacillus sp. HST-98]|uniref:hypothetical protein n=1 Tax=Lysinibacillus sp. HST-98 TaxID=2800419 RepID=UPI0019256905|nr:hypothetical protein [Lysinibacillus sp. HST-98]MBL3731566.1 hypothetical protein [Lysinibacillus sp. HST-98]
MIFEKYSYMSTTHKVIMVILLLAVLITLGSLFFAEMKNMNTNPVYLFLIVLFGATFFVYKDSQEV